MGNSIFPLAANVTLVASESLWLESEAVVQLNKTSELDGVIQAVGMPDLHPGRGYPIGASFLSQGRIYPALVGGDIGCGMALWHTDLKLRKLKKDKLEKKLRGADLDEGYQYSDRYEQLEELVNEYRKAYKLSQTAFDASLGTIGGGNHFAELQQLDEIHDAEIVSQIGLNKDSVCLLVHTGSRGFGGDILRKHVEAYSHDGVAVDTKAFDDYLHQHEQALKYAKLNRLLVAQRFMTAMQCDGSELLDVHHNLVEQTKHGYVHRKGCTPADQGLVMIPGSRGSHSYLVKPLDNLNAARALYSLAHGAGRKWQRSECKARLRDRYKRSELVRTKLGSHVICNDAALIYEEAPEAYKCIDSVIQSLVQANLVEIVARFAPIISYKTNKGSSCS
ncbi:RNA ligase RtcB family protein [Microbulbifer agarilyticus]|uniref:RNA ligase RtcB family protein n=1 Tax=Microbulbifer agarilyticus TaxID=260552 RepID=UPI001C9392EE|nr:RNA ligase RtcB family protein [Microbulbifer agarilyticus]MBY6212308.1 RNA ligase RtcB family protein [Microbulbifer agarilyticus]